jgi:hypothetical protein
MARRQRSRLAIDPKGISSTVQTALWPRFSRQRTKSRKRDPIAYAGPYSVDEEQQVVHQQADVSLVPGWAGKTHSRKVRMEGDRLILSTVSPAILSGRRANAVITWQRVGA